MKFSFSSKIRKPFMPKWSQSIPDQITRLAVLVVLIVAAFLIIRPLLIPEGFGTYGHFRKGAMDDEVSKTFKYAVKASGVECHEAMQPSLCGMPRGHDHLALSRLPSEAELRSLPWTAERAYRGT